MTDVLPPLREVIARHGLDARHSLGQHFLLDGNLTAKIAGLAAPLGGRHVLEVGPGPGGLTRALLASQAADVTAIEIDRRAVAALGELQAVAPARLRVVQGDAVKLDLAGLVPAPRQIIANLPYNVATPLLIGWLRRAADFEKMLLMFQQEVAERICAAPGEPAYGRLSVLVRATCQAAIVLRLPPAAFTPAPKVHSAVVRLLPHAQQPAAAALQALERVTAAAFGQRRKMLRASLKPLGGAALLDRAGIDGERRAETLSEDEFSRLAGLL
jgi:16S rRNA (adenine1518-N6/adenine1519-N6)-dimethyltransferase